MNQIMEEITDWARANWLVLGLAAAVLVAGWILSRIARNLRQATAGASKDWVKYLIRFANAIALAFNAEGMYFLLRDDVKTIPTYLAAGGFFIFELFQVINMALAGRKYKAERTPGKYASMVWLIALAAVSVVCMNAGSAAEVGLRVALAVIVVLGWQVTLTADGVTKSRWVFAHWWESKLANAGLKIGKDTNDGGLDYDEIARAAKVRKLVTLSDKVEHAGVLTGWRVSRLNRLIRNTAEEDMAKVIHQLSVARAARVRLGLAEEVSSGSASSGTAGTPELSDGSDPVSGPVLGHGTGGTGRGSSGTGSGTDRGHGTGTDPELGHGTGASDTEPLEVLIMSAFKWIEEHDGKMPTVDQAQVIFAAPGKLSSNRRRAGEILRIVRDRMALIEAARLEIDKTDDLD